MSDEDKEIKFGLVVKRMGTNTGIMAKSEGMAEIEAIGHIEIWLQATKQKYVQKFLKSMQEGKQ